MDSSLLLSPWIRGILAAALVGFAGNWSGPAVLSLALASGLSFFDLGRRDRVERDGERTAFEPDLYGPAMQLAFLGILCAGAWDNRGPGMPITSSSWTVPTGSSATRTTRAS